MDENLKAEIERLWNEKSHDISCIHEAMQKLDSGTLRIAQKIDGKWHVHDYLKKAILLFFKHTGSKIISGSHCKYFDKIPMKTEGWTEKNFAEAGFRLVPGAIVRYSAHVARSAIIMSSFVNVGAFIDEETLVDTNALVGSCAQIGKKCHISDAVTIGGVLEPLQATPVVIEDNCFIGVKCALVEGILVQEGAVLAAGTCITSSTKIINRDTGEISYGCVPPYSVVVPGSYSTNGVNISCAVIVKQVSEQTRRKTSLNELLRL
ncbi:MAG: 2,3,4,5-tetrahydropyridine-2,6-dicarboxylate N-succinyltransferase [Holosporaceae bacterium]|jgi:2,3,4,5-tetrahydropyridine-2-carboxylate N-succinyltransferase|nr:2,3,4,5-tetrahydropyridine-2,6-dicarboxylate N-succinyltransferase [Holosporaceae bacterium]